MKKYIISLFLVAFLLAPVLSFAQEEDIDPNPNGSDCVALVNNLKYKSRDANTNGEVSTFQDFLQSNGYIDIEPTGYFGIKTLEGAKKFQKANNINPTGIIAAVSRAKIKTLTCGGEVVDTSNVCCEIFGYGSLMTRTPSVYEMMPKNQCSEDYLAAQGRVGGGRKIADNSFCKMDINKPIISGVSGPQTLNVNQIGTWTVKAYDKNGGNLSYAVSWGDEAFLEGRDSGMLRTKNISQQSATFTHSYSTAGTYTAIFTVTNNVGKSATTSLSVKVGQNEIAPSITVLSPNGGELINVSNPITVTFKSNNAYPAKHYISISDQNISRGYSLDSLISSYGVTFSQAQINQTQQSITVSIPASYNLDVNHNYKIEICVNNVCDKSDNYFRITYSNSVAPVISGVSGPQTLGLNQTGTWTVKAYDKNGGNLSYSVNWGDAIPTCSSGMACSTTTISPPQQSAIFTHNYLNAGTYNPTFTVTNSNGQSATTSLSVKVGGTNVNAIPQIISTIGNQSNYLANSEINFVVKTANGAGGIATIQEGYAVQAYVYPADDVNFSGNYLTPNPSYSYNASFSDGYWRVKMNAPSTSGSYNMRVVLYCSNPTICGVNKQDVRVLPFTVSYSNAVAPVISGISGPQTLGVSQTGTWTVSAYSVNGGSLSYSVNWGDPVFTCPTGVACTSPIQTSQQTGTFTHSYINAGTYNPTFTVTNSNGQSATTSLSVIVS